MALTREEANARRRARRAADPEGKAKRAAYRAANLERVRALDRAKAQRHKERRAETYRRWAAANRDRINERQRAARQTPEGTLNNRIRVRLHDGIRKGWGTSKERLLGWTIAELREHLERQFLKGMSWENMGEWHIDHIVPLASFTIAGPDDPELRRAWALTNLRPIWAKDNLRKSDKVLTLL